MSRTRITLIVAVIILTGLVYSLPRVKEKATDETAELTAENQASGVADHSGEHDGHDHDDHDGHDHSGHEHGVKEDVSLRKQLVQVKESYENSEISAKRLMFADSLAGMYKSLGQFDSAAFIAEQSMPAEPSADRLRSVGEYFYDAFQYASDRSKASEYGEKTRKYLAMYLKDHPEDLSSKTHLAMTYASTDQPMKAVMSLREVLAKDPDQPDALFAMGMLSMQSGQYEKAVQRFKHLVEVSPQHLQARFYLGLSYFELGKKSKAKSAFEWVVANSDDPVVQATAGDYLEQLQ